MVTASEILEKRAADRKANIIAHTPNVNGDFIARYDCCCYNCRDYLDPTGEEDANRQNGFLVRQDTLSIESTSRTRSRTREAIDESEDVYEPLPLPEKPTEDLQTQEKSS